MLTQSIYPPRTGQLCGARVAGVEAAGRVRGRGASVGVPGPADGPVPLGAGRRAAAVPAGAAPPARARPARPHGARLHAAAQLGAAHQPAHVDRERTGPTQRELCEERVLQDPRERHVFHIVADDGAILLISQFFLSHDYPHAVSHKFDAVSSSVSQLAADLHEKCLSS